MTPIQLADELLEIETLAERLVVLSNDVCDDYFGTSPEKINTKENQFLLSFKYRENMVKSDMVRGFALDILEKLQNIAKVI